MQVSVLSVAIGLWVVWCSLVRCGSALVCKDASPPHYFCKRSDRECVSLMYRASSLVKIQQKENRNEGMSTVGDVLIESARALPLRDPLLFHCYSFPFLAKMNHDRACLSRFLHTHTPLSILLIWNRANQYISNKSKPFPRTHP